jgi:hypothetical protein
VRGVDLDEAAFLNEIDEARMKKEKEMRLEEKKALEELKALRSKMIDTDIPKITLSLPAHKKEKKQAQLLSNAIATKRKRYADFFFT